MARPARHKTVERGAGSAGRPGDDARPRRLTLSPAANDNASRLRKGLLLAVAGLALALIVAWLLAG